MRTVSIDGIEYQVGPAMMDQVAPYLGYLDDEDKTQRSQAISKIVMASIKVNGQPVQPNALPLPHYAKLMEPALQENALGNDES